MGQRVMFTLVDGRVMFFDLDVAQRINELQPKPREPFYLVKNQQNKRGSPVEWRAWRSPDERAGEQGDGTFAVPSGKAAASVQPPPRSRSPPKGTHQTAHTTRMVANSPA